MNEAVRKEQENQTFSQSLPYMAQKLWINGLIEKSSPCTLHPPETPTNDFPLPVNTSVNRDSPPPRKPGNHLRPYLCALSSVISQTPVIYTAVNSTLATRQFLIYHPFLSDPLYLFNRGAAQRDFPSLMKSQTSNLAHSLFLGKVGGGC